MSDVKRGPEPDRIAELLLDADAAKVRLDHAESILSEGALKTYKEFLDFAVEVKLGIVHDVDELDWDDFAEKYGFVDYTGEQRELYSFLKWEYQPAEGAVPEEDLPTLVTPNTKPSSKRNRLLAVAGAGLAAAAAAVMFVLPSGGDKDSDTKRVVTTTAPVVGATEPEVVEGPLSDQYSREQLVQLAMLIHDTDADDEQMDLYVDIIKDNIDSGRIIYEERLAFELEQEDPIVGDINGDSTTDGALDFLLAEQAGDWDRTEGRPEGYNPDAYIVSANELEPLNATTVDGLAKQVVSHLEYAFALGDTTQLEELFDEGLPLDTSLAEEIESITAERFVTPNATRKFIITSTRAGGKHSRTFAPTESAQLAIEVYDVFVTGQDNKTGEITSYDVGKSLRTTIIVDADHPEGSDFVITELRISDTHGTSSVDPDYLPF